MGRMDEPQAEAQSTEIAQRSAKLANWSFWSVFVGLFVFCFTAWIGDASGLSDPLQALIFVISVLIFVYGIRFGIKAVRVGRSEGAGKVPGRVYAGLVLNCVCGILSLAMTGFGIVAMVANKKFERDDRTSERTF